MLAIPISVDILQGLLSFGLLISLVWYWRLYVGLVRIVVWQHLTTNGSYLVHFPRKSGIVVAERFYQIDQRGEQQFYRVFRHL